MTTPEDCNAKNCTINDESDLGILLRTHIEMEESRLDEGAKRMAQIEQDLRPLTRLYYSVVGASVVISLLIGSLLFIYNDDKEHMKELTNAVYQQGKALEKMIVMHQSLEKDVMRVEKDIEKHHSGKGN